MVPKPRRPPTDLQGLLRVSASDWFGTHVLTPVCAEFIARHAGMQVDLLNDARLYDLARGEADVVFRIQPLHGDDVAQRRLLRVDYALYGPAGIPCPVPGGDADVDVLTLDGAYSHFPDVAWIASTFPRARRRFGSNSREAQARLCALGGGFAVLPRLLADGLPGLERHDLPRPPPGRDVWMAHHRARHADPVLRAFEALARARLAPTPLKRRA